MTTRESGPALLAASAGQVEPPAALSRKPRSWPAVVGLVLALTVIASCGGGGNGDDETTTTKKPESTTSTAAPTPGYPLTGLPITDPAVMSRPALVVKIDNAEPASRPQQGLNQADIVYEEMVEGSVTRFAAVFHSTDAVNRVIPVRSARTTDVALFTPLKRPLFAWSGANADFEKIIRNSAIVDVGFDALGSEYRRDRSRPGSHDLYITTQQLWTHSPAGAEAPPAMFSYRAAGEAMSAAAKPVSKAHISFGTDRGSAPVDWEWDAGSGTWLRSQRGTKHVDETGQQVSTHNVVVQLVSYHDTGHRDTSGAVVYEADLIGEGKALLLSDGKVLEGKWTKATEDAVTQFTDDAGAPFELTPGRTWVELPWPAVASVTTE